MKKFILKLIKFALTKSFYFRRLIQIGFAQYYYYPEFANAWKKTTYLGVPILKNTFDLWNYQEIIYKLKPSLIIEFGVNSGGSSLYFSDILKRVNKNSKILSVDIGDEILSNKVIENSHIEFLKADSASEIVKKKILELQKIYKGKVFAILDSDHSKAHVLKEMKLLRDILSRGDYLIVEDSVANGNPLLPDFGDGPMEAIEEYFKEFPNDYINDKEIENRFGFTFAPKGYLIRQ